MPIQKVSTRSRVEAPMAGYESTPSCEPPKNKRNVLGWVVLFVVMAASVSGCVWSFKKYVDMKKTVATLTSPEAQQEAAKKEVDQLMNKVSKLIVLPAGEEPTVATITDADALKKEQQFYRDAQNGNKVLVYMESKKAIIYDEQKNILVNVGPIFLNEEATTTQAVAGEKIEE